MGFAIFDGIGMILFATGALWFAKGQSLFIPGYPGNMLEAMATLIGGLMLMLWAAAQIVRELIKRRAKNLQQEK